MPTEQTVVTQYRCERCDYVWTPRLPFGVKPVACANPKCHSPYWDRPRLKLKPESAPLQLAASGDTQVIAAVPEKQIVIERLGLDVVEYTVKS